MEKQKPTQEQRDSFKAEMMKPPFVERLSTKRCRNTSDDSYCQLTAEQKKPQVEK